MKYYMMIMCANVMSVGKESSRQNAHSPFYHDTKLTVVCLYMCACVRVESDRKPLAKRFSFSASLDFGRYMYNRWPTVMAGNGPRRD